MQVTMKRRGFLLGSSSTLMLAPVLGSAAIAALPSPAIGSGPMLSAPQSNDYSGILTLRGRNRARELLWQAGQAPFDQITLRLEQRQDATLLTLEKHALAHGTSRLQTRIARRNAVHKIAFRLSSTTGLQLFVDGELAAQATTPGAKANLSLAQSPPVGSRANGAERVLLINERIV